MLYQIVNGFPVENRVGYIERQYECSIQQEKQRNCHNGVFVHRTWHWYGTKAGGHPQGELLCRNCGVLPTRSMSIPPLTLQVPQVLLAGHGAVVKALRQGYSRVCYQYYNHSLYIKCCS